MRVCIDRVLSSQFSAVAEAKAAAEQASAGPLTAFEAALARLKRWKAGRTLRIRFLNGDTGLQGRVASSAKEWMNHANINLGFGTDPDAEIRVAFEAGAGSWSAVGTDALVEQWFPKTEATMNFGWLDSSSSDQDVSSVVLHEFGHALGLIHEHQAPTAAIGWDKERIYRELGGPPNNWPPETVDHNVFDRLGADELNYSAYDKTSIMHYFFPANWTTDGTVFPENTALSETDKSFIRTQYP